MVEVSGAAIQLAEEKRPFIAALCRLIPLSLLLCSALSSSLHAQPVRAVTEFARFTHYGDPFPQDGIQDTVEVLSPPLVKGVWNAFRIVVDVEPGQDFVLYVEQNPRNAMRLRILREVVRETGGKWEIVRRELVLLPFRSRSLPATERTEGRTTYTFWMEVQPPKNYPTRRLKLEPQLFVDGKWFIYPMEIRVTDPDVDTTGLPGHTIVPAADEVPEAQPDRYHAELMRMALCGTSAGRFMDALAGASVKGRERYSASVLARALDAVSEGYSEFGREEVNQIVTSVLGIKDQEAWCQAPVFPREQWGPEWPAVLRNRVLRLTGDP
jgi:hypothetical protein